MWLKMPLSQGSQNSCAKHWSLSTNLQADEGVTMVKLQLSEDALWQEVSFAKLFGCRPVTASKLTLVWVNDNSSGHTKPHL